MSAVETSTRISLKGSVDIVSEFFDYSINSILYQRGIYPPESFKRVSKYGLAMLITSDSGLQTYLNAVLGQLKAWLTTGTVQKLVVVVTGQQSNEVLERWVFDVAAENTALSPDGTVDKTEKEVNKEIAAIIRQITASVTFLPLLEEACTFDLLVYTDDDVQVPSAWEESDPKYITEADEVKLRSFTTKVHRVDACVSYKAEQ
mmetsp:Transcript_53659/g.117009  ORF Transcript_53659/g.117009 Transcript_53659/m.117009 type:complete len:203 (+) Transcript_53659:213-821(+)